jgi:MYXO-CTERM domain-containing protein
VIHSTTVTVPDVRCGDGFVDMPDEACEAIAGTTGPCACDGSCQFPGADTACDEGDTNPCTAGGCNLGHCMPLPLDSVGFVPACDHDLDPCTIEGCAGGVCDLLLDCPTPATPCTACDPEALMCDAPVVGMTGCCTSDADCSAGSCLVGACDTVTGTCTTPTPDPACLGDAGTPDAGSAPDDASTQLDAGNAQVDAGNTSSDAAVTFDASSATTDAGDGTHLGFGGGGGCRCRAGGGSSTRGAWLVLACVALAIVRRRKE